MKEILIGGPLPLSVLNAVIFSVKNPKCLKMNLKMKDMLVAAPFPGNNLFEGRSCWEGIPIALHIDDDMSILIEGDTTVRISGITDNPVTEYPIDDLLTVKDIRESELYKREMRRTLRELAEAKIVESPAIAEFVIKGGLS